MDEKVTRQVTIQMRVSMLAISILACVSCQESSSLLISAEQVSFTGNEGGVTPGLEYIDLDVEGDETLYLDAFYTGAPVGEFAFVITGGRTAIIELSPASPDELGVGVHDGAVIITICKDEACEVETSQSPAIIPVTYTVHPGMTFSTDAIEIDLEHEELPAARHEIALVPPDSDASWRLLSMNVDYLDDGDEGWLSIEPQGTEFDGPQTFYIDVADDVATGKYRATLELVVAGERFRHVHRVDVVYLIRGVMTLSPNPVTFRAPFGSSIPAPQTIDIDFGGKNHAYRDLGIDNPPQVPYWVDIGFLDVGAGTSTLTLSPTRECQFGPEPEEHIYAYGVFAVVDGRRIEQELIVHHICEARPGVSPREIELLGEGDSGVIDIDVGEDVTFELRADVEYHYGARGWLNVTPSSGAYTGSVQLTVSAGDSTALGNLAIMRLHLWSGEDHMVFDIEIRYVTDAAVR